VKLKMSSPQRVGRDDVNGRDLFVFRAETQRAGSAMRDPALSSFNCQFQPHFQLPLKLSTAHRQLSTSGATVHPFAGGM
jgi:hypothetical protein